MKNLSLLAFCFLLLSMSLTPVRAQAQEVIDPTQAIERLSAGKRKPAMQNVFFNVLWGSVAGGMGYTSLIILDDSIAASTKYSFSYMTEKFITGATYGAIFGLAAGMYLSMADISFDSGKTRIAFMPSEEHLRFLAWRRRDPGEVYLGHLNFTF